MTAYVLRRLVYMIPVFLLISLFVFFMVRLVPGDPALMILGQRATEENVAMVREKLHLNDPIWVQYGVFLGNLLRGDLGDSMRQQRPVTPPPRRAPVRRAQPRLRLFTGQPVARAPALLARVLNGTDAAGELRVEQPVVRGL